MTKELVTFLVAVRHAHADDVETRELRQMFEILVAETIIS